MSVVISSDREAVTPLAVTRALRMMGIHVSNWRKLQRLTAAQVAERAGISRDTLRAIEQGKGTANTENLFRVLRILGILDGMVAAATPTKPMSGGYALTSSSPAGSGAEHHRDVPVT